MTITSVQCSIGDQIIRNVTDLQRPDVCSINQGRNKCGSNYQRAMILECEERNNGWGRWSECDKVCICVKSYNLLMLNLRTVEEVIGPERTNVTTTLPVVKVHQGKLIPSTVMRKNVHPIGPSV